MSHGVLIILEETAAPHFLAHLREILRDGRWSACGDSLTIADQRTAFHVAPLAFAAYLAATEDRDERREVRAIARQLDEPRVFSISCGDGTALAEVVTAIAAAVPVFVDNDHGRIVPGAIAGAALADDPGWLRRRR